MEMATQATSTTAAVLAVFNPMSAASLQTMAVVGSMPCMRAGVKTVATDVSWMVCPFYSMFGSVDEDVLPHPVTPVLYNLLLLVFIVGVHSAVLAIVSTTFRLSWERAMRRTMYPNISVIACHLMLQATTTLSIRALQEDSARNAFAFICVLGLACGPVAMFLFTMYVVRVRRTTWHSWNCEIAVQVPMAARVFVHRGLWQPPSDVARYGAVFQDFLPLYSYFNAAILVYYVGMSSAAALPTGDGWCQVQLFVTFVLPMLLALVYLLRWPHRNRSISMLRGVGLLVTAVPSFLSFVELDDQSLVARITVMSMIGVSASIIAEVVINACNLVLEARWWDGYEKELASQMVNGTTTSHAAPHSAYFQEEIPTGTFLSSVHGTATTSSRAVPLFYRVNETLPGRRNNNNNNNNTASVPREMTSSIGAHGAGDGAMRSLEVPLLTSSDQPINKDNDDNNNNSPTSTDNDF